MKKVLGMGNALVDILSQIESDSTLDNLSLVKGSMRLIDNNELASLMEIVSEQTCHMVTGGSASNTISGLAKLGIDTGFIGKIGNDTVGDFFKEDVLKQGINAHLLTIDKKSGCCIALISPDGERTMSTHLGAACELNTDDLQHSIFKNYSIFHIEGYLVTNQELIENAMKLAKEAGLKISIDMASFNVVDENLAFLKKLITSYVDIVFANEEEAFSLTGKKAGEAAEEIARMCEIAIVKVGKEGSYIKTTGSELIHISALDANVVDTTGAGDSYAAGFLYGFTSGYPLNVCGKIGTLVATHAVEVIGPKIDDSRWQQIKETISTWRN